MADEEKITEEQAKELLQTMKAPNPQHIYENAEKNKEKEKRSNYGNKDK